MRYDKPLRRSSLPVYNTSWGDLPLYGFLNLGFKLTSDPAEGLDVFKKIVDGYTITISDNGGCPTIFINGFQVASLIEGMYQSRMQVLRLVRSLLAHPEKYLETLKYFYVEVPEHEDISGYPDRTTFALVPHYKDRFFKLYPHMRKSEFIVFNLQAYLDAVSDEPSLQCPRFIAGELRAYVDAVHTHSPTKRIDLIKHHVFYSSICTYIQNHI